MKNAITLRLDINGTAYLCDTYKDEVIQISKRVRTVEEIESAQGSITKIPFRAPLVGQLAEALGAVDELNSTLDFDIRKSINGAILVNNFPRFKGSYTVMGIYDDIQRGLSEVEFIFKGEETTLKQDLGERTLAELLDGETIPYNALEIKTFYDDPQAYYDLKGIAWPLIDYGQQFTGDGSGGRDINGTLTQRDFKPALGIKKVLSMLDVNIEFDMNDADELIQLLNHVIPLHNNESTLPTLNTSEKIGTGIMYIAAPTAPTAISLLDNVPFPIAIPYDATQFYSTNHFSTASKTYTAPSTGNYAVKPYVRYTVANMNVDSRITGTVQVKVNGTPIATGNTWANSDGTRIVTFQVWAVAMNAGDTLTMDFELKQTNSSVSSDTVDFNFENAELNVNFAPAVAASSEVLLSANIPEDLTVWDVIKSFISMINGVVVPTTEGYSIVPWTEWIEEGADLDIDGKVENSQTVKITPTSVEAPKRILFTYLEDEDVANTTFNRMTGNTYGQLLIADTGTELGTETKEVKIPFAPTPPLGIIGTSIYIPKFVDEEWKTVKTKPRLIKMSPNSVSFPVNFTLEDSVLGTTYPISSIPQFLHWETPEGGFNTNDWNWGTTPNFFAASGFPSNTLYKRYWEKYIVETYGEYGRKVSMKIFLTQGEFDGLEMNESIYWRGSKLRFNSINGFDISNTQTVPVEMIARRTTYNIDIAPYYPYDVINGEVQFKDSSDNMVVASPDPADLKQSCEAYGYYYDATQNACIQRAQLIEI